MTSREGTFTDVIPWRGKSSGEMLSIVRERAIEGCRAAFSAIICGHTYVYMCKSRVQKIDPCYWFCDKITLEHISCRADAMVLAGALQRNTWHLSMQVSLSLATKAKSLKNTRRLKLIPITVQPRDFHTSKRLH